MRAVVERAYFCILNHTAFFVLSIIDLNCSPRRLVRARCSLRCGRRSLSSRALETRARSWRVPAAGAHMRAVYGRWRGFSCTSMLTSMCSVWLVAFTTLMRSRQVSNICLWTWRVRASDTRGRLRSARAVTPLHRPSERGEYDRVTHIVPHCVDAARERVFGLSVTRAFGDVSRALR
jgi:hypothetical protein